MPPYFFHLKLELYTTPAASKRRHLTPATTNTPCVIAPGTDIFKTVLPAHETSKWSSYTFSKRPDTPHISSASGSEPSQSPQRLPLSERTEAYGSALLLPERSLNRTDTPRSPALRPGKPSNEAAARDWRYDVVSIESIDMEATAASKVGVAAQAKNGASGLHTKAVYIPSDPKTTEVGWGVVHLYRDREESSTVESEAPLNVRRTLDKTDEHFEPNDCNTLCILAVPSWMMPSDLLGFVGDQAREDVSHFRLIRTGRANKYMVLMKFRSAKKAQAWQNTYNGRLFSAAEPENCHVVFIKSVEFLSPAESDDEDGEHFPQNNQHDPFTPAQRPGSQHIARKDQSLSSKPLAPPPPNLFELPTCPVCLERMDETTGLLTILCQHVFHCACLEKWRFPGSGCPVCRYTQSPSYTFPYPRPFHSSGNANEDAEPACSVCTEQANVNLWICLICGNIGCGRYDSAHAYAHYEATSHCYAMDISTQHVWDYAGDGYVHRLIQSKPDFTSQTSHNGNSKSAGLAELGTRHENEAYRAEGGDMVPREKMESMANEYTYLLTSQLEGQRRYFEEQVERAADMASQASAKAEAAAAQAENATVELGSAKSDHQAMRDTLHRIEKALEKSEKARSKFEQMARDMSSQLREEKIMNEGLLKRIKAADEKAEQAKKEVDKAKEEKKDLEDMNHDLTMFISSQEKVKQLQAEGEEVVDGSVSVPDQKKKGKGRKK